MPLIIVQLNDSGKEEEEEFHLLLMGSYFNIKSLPERSVSCAPRLPIRISEELARSIHVSVEM